MILKKCFLGFAVLIFLYATFGLIFAEKAQSAGEFSISCQVDYSAADDETTQVTDKIELTNLTSKYFSSEYRLTLGDIKITDLLASNTLGRLEASQLYKDSSTTITIKFKDQLVGKDKSRKFTISYKTGDLTQKLGKIWQINIPKVGSFSDIKDYQVRLLVPITFGKMAYISPKPESTKEYSLENSPTPRNIYGFSKESVIQNGISASFGEDQFLKFNIGYNLKNDDFAPAAKEVPMPSDNAYQKVYISSIDPKPATIKIDADGNWIALYKLGSRQNIAVRVSGYAQVLPMALIPQPKLDAGNKNYYLSPQKFWESGDSKMISEGSRLNTPQAIYDFVANKLTLAHVDLTSERKGGESAYDNPKSVGSQEFSDLFITLCRAASIPARELEGAVVSSNGIFRHTWAEFWDENSGWIQVDPSLGKSLGDVDYFSKTDFNHLSLVTRGVDSQSPMAPDEINVEFSDKLPPNEGKLQISFDLPKYSISIFNTNTKLILENTGNIAIYNQKVEISLYGATLLSDKSAEIEVIPPFSKIEVPITLKPTDFLRGKNIKIETKLDNQQFVAEFKTKPGWILLLGIFVLTFAFCFGIYQLFLVTRKIRWPKRNV